VPLGKVGMQKPWSIVLGASSTTAVVGGTVALTATVNQDLNFSKVLLPDRDEHNSVLSALSAEGIHAR